MEANDQAEFRRYLQSIPDDLLLSVRDDCVWLAEVFADDPAGAGYRIRTAACLDEEERRGWPQLLRRSSIYSPAREKTASGAQAASAGGSWFTSPTFSNKVPIPQ